MAALAATMLIGMNASQRDVCLGAENNNNSSSTYTVSGYWDEETD